MALMSPAWAKKEEETEEGKEVKLIHLRGLHSKAMQRRLWFKRGKVDLYFDEDTLIDLLGMFLYEVKFVGGESHKETHGAGRGATVNEHTTPRNLEVIDRSKEELGNRTPIEFLAMLDDLAKDEDTFLQVLYGMKDDGLSQSLARAGDEIHEVAGSTRLFGIFPLRWFLGSR